MLLILLGLAQLPFWGILYESWRRDKKDFKRVKNALILELRENIETAKVVVNIATNHGFPVPLFRDDTWHLVVSSVELKQFGGTRVEDPIYDLGYIYSCIRVLNQTILARQTLIFSTLRAMDIYKNTLSDVDSSLKTMLSA